jgi:hypothetical protein
MFQHLFKSKPIILNGRLIISRIKKDALSTGVELAEN